MEHYIFCQNGICCVDSVYSITMSQIQIHYLILRQELARNHTACIIIAVNGSQCVTEILVTVCQKHLNILIVQA